jgi:hypothetical protein
MMHSWTIQVSDRSGWVTLRNSFGREAFVTAKTEFLARKEAIRWFPSIHGREFRLCGPY